MVIIRRKTDLEKIKNLGDWVWICGRRKTGKTFFVKNFLDYDEYFFVNRDGSVLRGMKRISYEAFREVFGEVIEDKKVVIDEIHRLPEDFFDYLHATKRGKLIGISSTLWLSKRLLGRGSPLMGLFSLLIFGLIDENDVLNGLRKLNLDKRELVEAAIYAREPIVASAYKPKMRKWLASFLDANRLAIREIIGEIFTEEERELSLVYEGILRAISSGKNKSGEISSYLFSRGLIKKDNPGLIQRYLDTLVKIGLVEKVEVYKKKRFVYRSVSPLFDLHFYLDEKYSYVENPVPERFIREVIMEKLPYHVERFFEDLLSKKLGMKKVVIEEPEIDIALTRFKKLALVGEVKWGRRVTSKEIKKVANKLNLFNCDKILIVPDRAGSFTVEGIRVVDVFDL